MNLIAQLEQLENTQLVRHLTEEEPAYIFRHTLTQETAYDALLKNQRRVIHRAVAQAYEKVYADRCMDEFAAILARHYSEAGDEAQALVYSAHAGDVAARIYANTEAIAFYTQALNLAKKQTNNSSQLLSLYKCLGRVHELAENYPHALELYREIQALGQARGSRTLELEALMLQTTAHAVGTGGVRDLSKAQEISAQALALAEELDDRKAQARIYWNLLLINRFGNEGPAKAVEYGEKSLALARELGLTEQIALTLKDLGVAYVVTGRWKTAKANLAENLALWRQLNNTPLLSEVIIGASAYAFAEGKLDEAIRLGEEAYSLNQSIGNRHGLSIGGSFLWYVYRERGQLQKAIATAETAIAIADELKIFGPPWGALVELAATFDWLGEYARAAEYAQRGMAQVIPNTPSYPIFPRAVLASVALHQGNTAAAGEWLAPFPSISFDESFQMNPAGGSQVANVFVELALARGDANRALQIADEAIVFNRKIGRTISLPSFLHLQTKALRMLNRADEAYALLTDARQQAEAMQSRYQLLPILFSLVEMEIERGNAAQARLRRDEARTLIEFIADHTPPGLRESFLNKPEVRPVMK